MMLRRLIFVISSLVFPLVFSGCFVLNLFDFGPNIDLGKNQWKISSFTLTGESFESKNLELTPFMRFDTKEFKVYGNTGCNTFFANYLWVTDKVIEMRNSGMTRRMCASENSMKFEQKLMEEFDGEFEVIEDGANLTLKKDTLTINLTPLNPSEEDSKGDKPQESQNKEAPSKDDASAPKN